jgi:hypothetical protein
MARAHRCTVLQSRTKIILICKQRRRMTTGTPGGEARMQHQVTPWLGKVAWRWAGDPPGPCRRRGPCCRRGPSPRAGRSPHTCSRSDTDPHDVSRQLQPRMADGHYYPSSHPYPFRSDMLHDVNGQSRPMQGSTGPLLPNSSHSLQQVTYGLMCISWAYKEGVTAISPCFI